MKNKVISFPYLVWALVFTLIPLLLIFYYGFTVELESGQIIFSTENFVKFFSACSLKLIIFFYNFIQNFKVV